MIHYYYSDKFRLLYKLLVLSTMNATFCKYFFPILLHKSYNADINPVSVFWGKQGDELDTNFLLLAVQRVGILCLALPIESRFKGLSKSQIVLWRDRSRFPHGILLNSSRSNYR